MADGLSVTEGSGKTVATDEIGGLDYQRVKLVHGADGVNDGDVASANPLPVITTAASAIDITDISAGAQTNDVKVTLDGETISINDISNGTQTNDVKITLDSEAVVLGAGSASIGTLGANSGVDIGDVDVTSVVPGTGATNLGKAEDTAHTTGDVGVMALGVRNDAGTAFGADGDYVPLSVNANGSVRVVTEAGDFVTEYTEDNAAPAAVVGRGNLLVRDDALSTVTPVEGDWIRMRGTAEGALWTQDFNSDTILANTTTIAGAVSGTEMQVDVVSSALPTGAATETTLAAVQTAVELIDNAVDGNYLNTNLNYAGTDAATGGGTEAGSLRVTVASDSTGVLSVDDNAGSLTVDNTSIDGPGKPTIDSYTHAAISAAAATANQVLVAAPGASKQIWVYGIQFAAGTGDGSYSIQDEDDTAITGVVPVAQYSGLNMAPSGNFAMPLWKIATNKALEVDTLVCDIKGSISYAIVSV